VTATLLALLTPLGPYALVLLVAVAFAETGLLAGFLLPADTLMVTAGVLVATGALRLPVWLSVAAITVAAAAGDQVAYQLGRRLAPRLGQRRATRMISLKRLTAARAFFDRHGARAVVLSRFVPVARTLTPLLAGVSGMDRRRFLLHNLVGATGWAAVMFCGGYWFGAIPFVSNNLELVLLALMAASALPGAAAVTSRWSGGRSAARRLARASRSA
jgi:membrane protein DedA with SNARE-associated domain